MTKWATKRKQPAAIATVLNTTSKESPLLRYERPLSRSSTFPKRQGPSSPATISTPRGVRLQPLNIDSSAATDAAADGDGEMELFKRSTPRNMRSFVKNFLQDANGTLAESIDLPKHARDSGNVITNSLIEEVASMHPNMRELNIVRCVELTDVGLWSIGRYCTKLERLNASYVNQFTHVGLRSMCLQCRQLKDLDFSHCPQFNDLCLRSVAAHCKNLERLTLRDGIHVTDRGLAEVAQGCTQLQYLNLNGCCRLSEYGDAALKRFAKFCKNLTYIDLTGCEHIGDLGVEALATCTKLHTLIFDNCLAGISKPKAVFELAALTNLTHLCLTGWSSVTNKAIKALSKKLTKLTVLNLSGIPAVTQDGLQHLRHCPDLVELDLSRCTKIAEKSLECLAKTRPHLETLSLVGCGRVRAHSLTTLTRQCTRLTTLRLSENKFVTRRYVEDLSAECPFSDFARDHFGLTPVPDHKACIRAEEVRRIHTSASIRIQAFVRGTKARGGVAMLRRAYFRLQAVVRMQKTWRMRSVYASTQRLLEHIKRVKVTGTIQRVWRGYQGRKVARKRRIYLHYLANLNAAATKIESVYRGHVVRLATAKKKRQMVDAKRMAEVRLYREHRCAVRVQKAFRDHKRRVIYWAAQALKKERERQQELRRLMAIMIQCRWRIFLAHRVYAQRVVEWQQRQFVRMVTKLQARLHGFRARMLRKKMEADRDWLELQHQCASVIQRTWRSARSRFTVKVLRSLARLRIAEVKAVKIMQRFARGCAGRAEVRMMMMLKELKLKQWKAAKKIQRIFRGNKGREVAEVTLALLQARRAAADLYKEVDRVEKERGTVSKKYIILEKKLNNLVKQRNHVAKELREAFQAKGKYYDSESLNPGVRQRYVVDFLKTELQGRLRTLKADIAPIRNVLGLLKDKISDYDRELRVLKRELKPFEGDVVENTLAARKKRMRKVLTEKTDSATMIQAIFRGYRVRAAMARSSGINHWVEMWDEEEETQCYFNTLTQERKFFKPAEISLFDVEPQKAGESKWVESWDGDADSHYYYNTETGDFRWEKPPDFEDGTDAEGKTSDKPPAENGAEWFEKQDKAALSARSQNTGRKIYEWEELQDPDTGQTYYRNPATNEMTWVLPPDEAARSSTEGSKTARELTVNGDQIPVAAPGEFIPIVGDVTDDTADTESAENVPETDAATTTATVTEDPGAAGGEEKDAPLDDDWEECEDEASGAFFYYNKRTGVSQWERPGIKQVKALMYMGAFNNKAGGEASYNTEEPAAVLDDQSEWKEGVQYTQSELTGDTGGTATAVDIEATPTPDEMEATGAVEPTPTPDEIAASEQIAATPTPDEIEATPTPDEVEDAGGLGEVEATPTPDEVATSEEAAANQDWEEVDDGDGNTYFYNHKTGVSQWERPFLLLSALAAFKTADTNGTDSAVAEGAAQESEEDPEWEEADDGEGNKYYYNKVTGESRWEKPVALVRAALAFQSGTSQNTETNAAPDNADAEHEETEWEEINDEDGNQYYYNNVTGESRWDLPTGVRARLAAVAMFQRVSSSNNAASPVAQDGEHTDATAHTDSAALTDTGEHTDASGYATEAGGYYDENGAYHEHGYHDTSAHYEYGYGEGGYDASNAQSYGGADAHYGTTGAIAPGWEEVDDGEGNVYYYNAATGESTWELPQ